MAAEEELSSLEDAVFRAPPRGFTAARDALAAALKAGGQAAEAKAVKAWRRPTVPVWLWNRLRLDGEASSGEAIAAASALAEAMGQGGAELSAGIAALRRAAGAVIERARAVARDESVGLSPAQERELGELVQALPWREEAREAAARGRLQQAPAPVDPLEAMRVLAAHPASRATPAPVEAPAHVETPASSAAQRARLLREAEAAAEALAAATSTHARARRALDEARTRLSRAEAQLADARRAAAEAAQAEDAAARALSAARTRHDQAAAALADAD
jgi:hypothetical protein